ncbi:hypothetical protein B0H17DRAFT_1213741 [Mycena rosella]|uniref:Uncharacterized protein n=1 Tax=Mycena rosella TaxID=1033263 RepID=A0AAD7CRY0_MYCRO|nr:hypothetical protein B0H17DRAFT_1213741 [Mycena rosella]
MPSANPAFPLATISPIHATLAQSDPHAAPSSAHDLKHYLRRADTHRRTGQVASDAGGGATASNRGGDDGCGDGSRARDAGFASGLTDLSDGKVQVQGSGYRDFS